MIGIEYFLDGSSKAYDFSALYGPNGQDNIKAAWISVGESIAKAFDEQEKRDKQSRAESETTATPKATSSL